MTPGRDRDRSDPDGAVRRERPNAIGTGAGLPTSGEYDFDYDVAIVGGGPTGCSAGVFTARYGLETVIFDRGRSSIRRCAYLENYLGFPAGIDVETFCALAREHATEAGCEFVSDLVASIEWHVGGTDDENDREDSSRGGFLVRPQEGDPVTARFVIAATKYDGSYLRSLDDPDVLFETLERESDDESHDRFDPAYPDVDGRTPVDGLYVAGPLAGAGDQAIVAAGHGAQVARTLLEDLRADAGYWGHLAERYDWVRRAEELTGEWADRERWREWFDGAAPSDLELESDEFARRREAYIDERFGQYVDRETVERRRRRGQRRLAEHLSDGALLEALDDETILAYAAELEREPERE